MLQPPDSSKNSQLSSNPNSYTPVKTASSPMEQATIGRSLIIKGEVSGSESLFIDGKIEGTIQITDNRVTVGRNGQVKASISAREVVIMGKVHGNVQCTDRLDLRGEGSLTGDVITQRISVEDGAVFKGSIEVRAVDTKNVKTQPQAQGKSPEPAKPSSTEQPKAAAAAAGA